MHFVYLIITKNKHNAVSYVGYTNNLKKRILCHNTGKGAKFTKGRKWNLIYFREYKSKNIALKEEYKLKKNYGLRKKIKNNYIQNENISIITL